ncbi:MAG: HPr family phosphocarrier protein [bacterium]|jgi:phosphotransferase system HPr (HPr) family protein
MTTLVHQSVPQMMVLTNPIGWHLRQAAVLVKTASRFTSNIIVECCGRSASAKSVIAILGLIAEANGKLCIKATGPDAHEAIHAITSECL